MGSPKFEDDNDYSPIATLPPEILSTIFRYTSSNDFDSTVENVSCSTSSGNGCILSAFVLSSVSSRWRQVALSTPELWLQLDLSKRSTGQSLALLHLFSQRSSNRLLDIRIQAMIKRRREIFYLHPDDPAFKLTELEYTTFVRYSTKVGKLTLQTWSSKWPLLLSTLGPQLVELKVRLLDWAFPPPDLLTPDKFVWRTSVTVLDLTYMLVTHALQLLFTCPNLIEYHFHRPLYEFDPDQIFRPSTLVTLNHLKHMEWGVDHEPYWSEITLQHLCAPVLEHFCWVAPGDCTRVGIWENTHDFYRDLGHFLSAASATLIEVEIYFPFLIQYQAQGFVPTIVASAPCIRRLTLSAEGMGVSLPGRINLFISPLRGAKSQSSDSSPPLPCLTNLRFVSRSRKDHIEWLFAPSNGEEIGTLILCQEITRERRELFGVSSFQVELDFDYAWDVKKYSLLKQLVGEFIRDGSATQ